MRVLTKVSHTSKTMKTLIYTPVVSLFAHYFLGLPYWGGALVTLAAEVLGLTALLGCTIKTAITGFKIGDCETAGRATGLFLGVISQLIFWTAISYTLIVLGSWVFSGRLFW
jgi:hypothetical protein